MARSQAGEQSFQIIFCNYLAKLTFEIIFVNDLDFELKFDSSHRGINPDEAVAYGAAVQAGVLSGEQDTGKFNHTFQIKWGNSLP